jgi:hypothetical protein
VQCNFVGHHEDIANRSTQFRVFQLLKELLSTLLEDVTKVSIDTTCWSKGKSCYLFIFSSMNFAEFFFAGRTTRVLSQKHCLLFCLKMDRHEICNPSTWCVELF